jgi:predicted  nucleic acid-binding Zn-ribbon protein
MSDTPETDAEEDASHNFAELVVPSSLSRRLERARGEAREELRKANVEANALATSIQKAEYPDAKEFELLGSVAGVISQIDNMYAGVRQQRDEAREAIRVLAEHGESEIQRITKERDEARDTVEQLTKHGLDLMDTNRMLKRELKRLKENTK